jgi:hypothetical protein
MQKVSPEALTYSLGKKGFFAPFPNFLQARAAETEQISSTTENAENTRWSLNQTFNFQRPTLNVQPNGLLKVEC